MKILKNQFCGVLILLITSGFFINCSKEEQIQPESEQNEFQAKLYSSDLSTAIEMYRDMMRTPNYLEYKNSQQLILNKMNSNFVFFSSKKDWTTWLETNLNKTSFTSIEEFSYLFDDSVNKLNRLIASNQVLYDFMADADINDLSFILLPEQVTPPNQSITNSCIDGCMDANEAASAASWNQFIEEVEDGMQQGGLFGSIAIWLAERDYNTRGKHIK